MMSPNVNKNASPPISLSATRSAPGGSVQRFLAHVRHGQPKVFAVAEEMFDDVGVIAGHDDELGNPGVFNGPNDVL